MTTGHIPTEEITRNRKRPKKTSTNSTIAREVFNGQYRKELEIPLFIDSYKHHQSEPKPQFPNSTSSDFTNISQETPFIFKGNPGRPRVSIPAKITPISRHQHIKTTTRGWCLICRDSEEIHRTQIAKEESIVHGTIFKVSDETLNEVLRPFKGPKRIRGKSTFWKCSECAVPICRPGEPCWDIAHRRLFNK